MGTMGCGSGRLKEFVWPRQWPFQGLAQAFAELGAGERDRRLQCGSSRSNDIEGEASNARASSASRSSMQISSGQSQSPSMVESECEPEQPESWAIGATVIHGKRKHQFYFENFEIAAFLLRNLLIRNVGPESCIFWPGNRESRPRKDSFLGRKFCSLERGGCMTPRGGCMTPGGAAAPRTPRSRKRF